MAKRGQWTVPGYCKIIYMRASFILVTNIYLLCFHPSALNNRREVKNYNIFCLISYRLINIFVFFIIDSESSMLVSNDNA